MLNFYRGAIGANLENNTSKAIYEKYIQDSTENYRYENNDKFPKMIGTITCRLAGNPKLIN